MNPKLRKPKITSLLFSLDELEQILASLNQVTSIPHADSQILNKQDSNPFGLSSTSEDDISEHTTSANQPHFTPSKITTEKTSIDFTSNSSKRNSIPQLVTRTLSNNYLEERVDYTHQHIIPGRTALHLAITAKQEKVVDILLAYQQVKYYCMSLYGFLISLF